MIEVLIQAERGSRYKRRYDERTLEHRGTGLVARRYPYPYGFVPGTRAPDGDCVDCYVLTRRHLHAGDLVACEPVALLRQEEDGARDDKVLAVLPDERLAPDEAVLEELTAFIHGAFSWYPRTTVRIGGLLPLGAAFDYLERCAGGPNAGDPPPVR